MTTPIMVCQICKDRCTPRDSLGHLEETGHNLWEMDEPNEREKERIESQL